MAACDNYQTTHDSKTKPVVFYLFPNGNRQLTFHSEANALCVMV